MILQAQPAHDPFLILPVLLIPQDRTGRLRPLGLCPVEQAKHLENPLLPIRALPGGSPGLAGRAGRGGKEALIEVSWGAGAGEGGRTLETDPWSLD